MNRTRYEVLSTTHALSRGLPLAPALERAMGQKPSRRERNAIASARAGNLKDALSEIGIDPLVAAVAQLAPEQSAEVEVALSRMPAYADLQRRALRVPFAIFIALAIIQFALCAVLVMYVVPTLRALAVDQGHSLPLPTQFFVDLMVYFQPSGSGLLLLGIAIGPATKLLRGPLSRLFRTHVLWSLAVARVCASASVLVRAGRRPEEVLSTLMDAERAGGKARSALSYGTLDGPGLTLLAETFAIRASARANRIGDTLRVVIAAGGAFFAMIALFGIYLAIFHIGPGVGL